MNSTKQSQNTKSLKIKSETRKDGNGNSVFNDDLDIADVDIDKMFASQLKGNSEYSKKAQDTRNNLSITYNSGVEFKAMADTQVINNQHQIPFAFGSLLKCATEGFSNELMKNLCHGFVDCLFGMKEEIDKAKQDNMKLHFMWQAYGYEPKMNTCYNQIDESNEKERELAKAAFERNYFHMVSTDTFTFDSGRKEKDITPAKKEYKTNLGVTEPKRLKESKQSKNVNTTTYQNIKQSNALIPQGKCGKQVNEVNHGVQWNKTKDKNNLQQHQQQQQQQQQHQASMQWYQPQPQPQISKPNWNYQSANKQIQQPQQATKLNNPPQPPINKQHQTSKPNTIPNPNISTTLHSKNTKPSSATKIPKQHLSNIKSQSSLHSVNTSSPNSNKIQKSNTAINQPPQPNSINSNLLFSNTKSLDIDIINEWLEEQFSTTNKKAIEGKENKCKNEGDDIITNVKDIKDEEFDWMMNAWKKGKKQNKTGNMFTVPSNRNNQSTLNQGVNKKPKNEDDWDVEMDIKDIKDIKDDEFDSMMKNLKNGKKVNIDMIGGFTSSANVDFRDYGRMSNEDICSNNNESNTSLIKSDFTAGGKVVEYKPSSKLQKLMCEMEADVDIDGIDTLEETKDKISVTKSKTVNTLNTENNLGNKMQVNIRIPNSSKRKYKQVNKENEDPKIMLNNPRLMRLKQNQYKLTTKEKILKTQFSANKSKTLKEVVPETPKIEIPNKVYNLNNIATAQFYCLCYAPNSEATDCWICNNTSIIDVNNFHIGFYYYITGNADNNKYKINTNDSIFQLLNNKTTPANKKETETYNNSLEFFKYQYRIVVYKVYLLSKNKPSSLPFPQSITEIFAVLAPKYKSVFLFGKRSFWTKVSEKDATINQNMILQILNISKSTTVGHENDSFIELTDGYKSAIAVIEEFNPINPLIKKHAIRIGDKLNIGLARWVKVTENYELEIMIFYNSIRLCTNINERLGPVKGRQFMIKNWINLRSNGGDVSMINVFVLKKYRYFINDKTNWMKYTQSRFDEWIEKMKEKQINELWLEQEGDESATIKERKKKNSITEKAKSKIEESEFKSPEKLLFQFKIICCDALLFYNLFRQSPACNNKKIDQNLLKDLKTRKCTINITLTNLGAYEAITEGKIYKMMWLNVTNKPLKYDKINGNYELFLNANDSLMFFEEPWSKEIKSDANYNDFISSQLSVFKVSNTNDNLCTTCVKSNYKLNLFPPYIGETNLKSLFYKKFTVKKELTDQSRGNPADDVYLTFVGREGVFVLIKWHDLCFYNLETFEKEIALDANLKKNNFKMFHWENIMFKSMLTYDEGSKTWTPINHDKLDKRKVILFLETYNYTTFSVITRGDEYQDLVKEVCENHRNNYAFINSISGSW